MLVLYNTAKMALSQHGLIELCVMMGTSYIYVVQFYSHWFHVATEYLICAHGQ